MKIAMLARNAKLYSHKRLKEAAGLGFKRAIIPEANRPRQVIEGMTTQTVKSLDEAISAAF